MNINRKLSKFDCEIYNQQLQKNKKIKIYDPKLSNKTITNYKLVDINYIRSNYCSLKCVYCNSVLKVSCEIKIRSVIQFLKHIKSLEKKTGRYLVYFPEENKRIFKNESDKSICTLPTFHPTLNEMEDFQKYVQSLSEVGQRFGAVKIVPPKGLISILFSIY